LEELKEHGLHDFESKVVITIGSPKGDPFAKKYYDTLDWNKNNPTNTRPVWVVPPDEIKASTDDFKLPYGNVVEKEKSGKKNMITRPS
jgi:type I restriction enzyme R subunit